MNRVVNGALAATLLGAVATQASATVVISEVYRNPDGGDNGREFIELAGPADASLDGYALVVIEGDNGSSAVRQIQQVFDFTGRSTGSNGLFLWRDADSTLRPEPDPATSVYVQDWTDMQNGDMTVALVRGFTGSVGQSVDSDGDGTLDHAPWTEVVDAFDFHEVGTRSVYAGQLGGWAPEDSATSFEKNAYVRSGDVRYIIDTNQSPDNTTDLNGPYVISALDRFQTDTTGAVWDASWTLTPGSANPVAVPEPASLALAGVAGLLALRRRRA